MRAVKVALVLVGFGNVARRFVQLLEESRETLAAEGLEPVVVGIVTRRHGSVYDKAGLDANRAAHSVAKDDALGPASSSPSALECLAQLRSQSIETRVLIETTPLDIRSAEPAISHVRAAFSCGAHVITANKGPAAFAYRTLAAEAKRAGVAFLFEGAVMDGVPVFSLVRDTLPGVEIRGFRGVVNSTTNHILTAMARGVPFEAALAAMQRAGIAEADASLDIDGWDAAAKAAVLANVLLDADTTPPDVVREGIGPETAARVASARASGRELKLVAQASGRGAAARPVVSLMELDPADPLAALDDQGNALELDTWPLGRVVITQRDGGLEKTAYALFSDLIRLERFRLRCSRK
jgi:homoserine dehydrogenase